VANYDEKERELRRELGKNVDGNPTWEVWLSRVRGIGRTLGGLVLAFAEPLTDFPTVSDFWSYAGYGIHDGKADRFRTGVVPNWCEELKRCGFLIGDSFIKAGGSYRALYDQYRERDRVAHPEIGKAGGKWSDAHMLMRGRRYMVKMFLSHLWMASFEVSGTPIPSQPYGPQLPGHGHTLTPWMMMKAGSNPQDDEGENEGDVEPVPT
jgi:hypothetical protein